MNSEMELHRFTDMGLKAFRSYLARLRLGAPITPPFEWLTDPKTAKPLPDSAVIENRPFINRLAAAVYLDDLLADIEADEIESDVHLWSWLSLFYLDQVCPPDRTGGRKPGRDYRHILEPGYPYGHNHLLCGAYLVYTIHELGKELSALLLYTPMNRESGFHHMLANRLNFISNRGIMEAAHLLYFNQKTGKPKPGSTAKKRAGGLIRFIDVLQQLDLTYDLYSMSGREILNILPDEFNEWRPEK